MHPKGPEARAKRRLKAEAAKREVRCVGVSHPGWYGDDGFIRKLAEECFATAFTCLLPMYSEVLATQWVPTVVHRHDLKRMGIMWVIRTISQVRI